MIYDNKKLFVLGMARSGYEVCKLLSKYNCDITITDKVSDKEKEEELTKLGIKCIISDNQEELIDESYDYIIKNPGVKIDSKPILKANKLNIPVINEVEVAYHFLNNVNIIGITGSNGKTTTTTLIYEILKKANKRVHLGGNIGYPLSSLVLEIKGDDILVIELSGQQLHDFKDFKCNVAILTNIVPVHLDFFLNYDFYKECKKKIFNNCDIGLINGSNADSVELTKEIDKLFKFNSSDKADLCIKENAIYFQDEHILDLSDIKLKGKHNYENIMCAIFAVKQYGISNEVIKEVISEFYGVEHRLEYVDTKLGVKYYNDSKSTNVESTTIALKSFDEPTVLLLGGLDRNHPFDELLPFMENVKCVISYGETKQRIFDFCNKNSIPCYITNTLKEAIDKSLQYTKDGDVVLLSPACASWDQYDKFEDRGNDFKNIISLIK